jgi:hypothetical protein
MRMRRAALCVLLSLVSLPSFAGDFYVGPEGRDSNPGSRERPWRTIAKATASLGAGDTLRFLSGTWKERLAPSRSGSPGRPITFTALDGAAVTLDGSGIVLPDDLAGVVEVAHVAWIVVSGLHVINAGPCRDNAGIMVLDSHDVVVRGCAIEDTTSSGIGVWASSRVLVDGCSVTRAGSGGYQESITVAGTDGFEVRGCTVRDCRKEGICLKDGASNGSAHGNLVQGAHSVGIYIDAWDKHTHDIEVFGNTARANDGNGIALASEMGGFLENVSVHDNVCDGNRFIGIQVSTNGDSAAHPMAAVAIVNNTCAGNGWEDWGGGIALDNPDARAVVIRNNICSANRYFQLLSVPAVPQAAASIDHNLVDGFGGTEGEIRGRNPVEGDPLFVDPRAGDYRLRAGSPAIDSGSPLGSSPKDFDGQPRPRDGNRDGRAAPDIGAFERQGG